MPDFIPGLTLSESFFNEVVRPILASDFPGLVYSAGLIGSGSEVLGFDTSMSSDHHWGPRVMLFFSEADFGRYRDQVHEALRHKLPVTFRGYSTHFSPPNPQDNNVQQLQTIESGPVNHRVEIFTIPAFFKAYLGFDAQQEIKPADWLSFPEQKLRSITGGAVFYDGISLNSIRSKFTYYPPDVWLYLLAAGWARIGEEEHLMGRAGMVGDEIGAQLIAARLVRDMMRLCFLMERQYAPYAKWFGTAFSHLNCAGLLLPVFERALAARKWKDRERHLNAAYTVLAEMHNLLEITPYMPADVRAFFSRPFMVIEGGRFAEAIKQQISDPAVKRIAAHTMIGSVDLFSDSTALLEGAQLRSKLVLLYGEDETEKP